MIKRAEALLPSVESRACGELSPFPAPAHRTGRADFPHPALRLDSLQRYRWDASSCTAHVMHSQIVEDRRVLELTGAPRGHLVTPLQKVSHSRSHMGIHGSIALAFAAVAEISLSPLQHSIEPVAHLRPRPDRGRSASLILALSRFTLLPDALAPR